MDYVSVNSAAGFILSILHSYAQRNPQIISLLRHKVIWIVPILNVDSLDFLLGYYKDRSSITFIYKNRKEDNYTNEEKCGRNGLGVNLNKNFPVGFNYDSDITSEDYPCSTNYGGTGPLSENETVGLDKIVQMLKPSLQVSLFSANRMITYPNLNMLDKNDQWIDTFKRYIDKLAIYNELQHGVSLYDPLKHEKSSLYSKGGNLDEYLLYQKSKRTSDLDVYSLNYFVGQSQQQTNSFLPKKESISELVTDHSVNLQMLACYAGRYVRYAIDYQRS